MKNLNFFDKLFTNRHLKRQKFIIFVFVLSYILAIFASSKTELIKLNYLEIVLFMFLHIITLIIFGVLRYLPGYIDFKISALVVISHMLAPSIYGLVLFFTSVSSAFYIVALTISGIWMFVHLGILIYRNPQLKKGLTVGVYGAGIAGQELVSIMNRGSRYTPEYFIDDDENLSGCIHSGLPVYDWESVKSQWNKFCVDMIFVSIPSMKSEQRALLLDKVSDLSVTVRFLPYVDELIDSQVSLSQLRSVTIDDILNRSEVSLVTSNQNNTLSNKTALVTGGGGSIGLEICLQLLKTKIKRLIVIDHSEFALVEAEKRLNEWCLKEKSNVQISYELGTVLDLRFLETIFEDKNIDFVFHAAAYKHVPVLERNVIQGVKNNVLGTENILKLANNHKIESFTLISTDKAVRPSNVMGASKRLCEAICLKNSSENCKMRVQVVRFGNVLGSSGSVTVTHKEIERFFMSIAEAASLVVSSTQINSKEKLFVLDMGSPIKILEFAKKLIKMHGYMPFIEGSDEIGNLAIQISGLRPGEKLYEELSIDNNLVQTDTPKIFLSKETYPLANEVDIVLSETIRCLQINDSNRLRKCFIESFIGMGEQSD
jgi:FlaA1/EpsC-like NDP-sugar epimerase